MFSTCHVHVMSMTPTVSHVCISLYITFTVLHCTLSHICIQYKWNKPLFIQQVVQNNSNRSYLSTAYDTIMIEKKLFQTYKPSVLLFIQLLKKLFTIFFALRRYVQQNSHTDHHHYVTTIKSREWRHENVTFQLAPNFSILALMKTASDKPHM